MKLFYQFFLELKENSQTREKGADGFIKFDENKSIYFRVNTTEEIKNKLNVGLEVEFKIIPATNGKKEKAIQLKTK